jgi:hypothetical protein
MMSTEAKNPAITSIPVQLSAHEFTEFIFPHLSMPKRGPKCKIGYHRLFIEFCTSNQDILTVAMGAWNCG